MSGPTVDDPTDDTYPRRLRVTLDSDQVMFDQTQTQTPNVTRRTNLPDVHILELKCDSRDKVLATKALADCPVRASRFSKYTVGIELLDIRFKRINYNESVRPKIYDRMISERRQIAAGGLTKRGASTPRGKRPLAIASSATAATGTTSERRPEDAVASCELRSPTGCIRLTCSSTARPPRNRRAPRSTSW